MREMKYLKVSADIARRAGVIDVQIGRAHV